MQNGFLPYLSINAEKSITNAQIKNATMVSFAVVVSIVANSIVLLTLWARRKRMKATHWFIMALAISDISFSLLLHPMIIATSFGADANRLFTSTGTVD